VKKRLVAWLVLIPFCILLVLFTLANRQIVLVRFDPFVSDPAILPALEVPLFLIIYFMLLIGVILGGVATWFAQGGQRRQKRLWRKKAKQLQNQQELQKQSGGQDSRSGQQPII